MRGRRPKPTNLKKLTGNPGKRRLREDEPVATGTAECPEHLDAIGRREWERVAPLLQEMGILASIDADQDSHLLKQGRNPLPLPAANRVEVLGAFRGSGRNRLILAYAPFSGIPGQFLQIRRFRSSSTHKLFWRR